MGALLSRRGAAWMRAAVDAGVTGWLGDRGERAHVWSQARAGVQSCRTLLALRASHW